ncbi:uncharacterized protein LOC130675991 [Microplitis mediator]|uniref:uncharacterized protein LOC130675339 n=1 Tax=Microplitis mediator TaxID=375433 RepID=UPI002554EC65|nr:uncharacterized protein LOC130675339 [Microplitis mediator]XP_057337917.1 uncharacterized protein LOC130675991 [Microplitis mediator]
MDIVITIQGFWGNKGTFIPKEICAVSIREASFIAHWIIKPSENYEDLTKTWRSANNTLTLTQHGIEWFDGDTERECVYNNIRQLVKLSNKIYTVGFYSTNFLTSLLNREIINIESDIGGTSSDLLPPKSGMCFLHTLKRYTNPHRNFDCAFNITIRVKKFIKERCVPNTSFLLPLSNVHSTNNDSSNGYLQPKRPSTPVISSFVLVTLHKNSIIRRKWSQLSQLQQKTRN